MFVIDTNVISELMRLVPSASVVGWIDSQLPEELFTTAISQAELFYGLQLMPVGRRRDQSILTAEEIIQIDLGGRVLSFDMNAADHYAVIAARRRRMGRPISTPDAQIAAIALVNAAVLVTRNVSDFEHCGIEIINPWLD